MAFKVAKKREPVGEAGLFEYAVRMLASRMRTERELRRLMQRRAMPGDEGEQAMNAVVARLKELNYLSDVRFAADYTRLRKEGEKFGRRRVQQDLTAKGVSAETVGAAIGAAYEGVDEVELARQYCARKRMKQPSGGKAKQESARVMGRLLRAGFSAGTVFKVLREWGVAVEEFEVEE
ncbi:MAG: RecX family transcriptional regulator [Acidobacteriaceae bacterium]|nr:RecX family transcriptional regulator [Acidobacteriaceae bacterium]